MLSRDDIVRLLGELADELQARGVQGDLHVQSLYPRQPVPPRAHYLLLELFPAAGDE